MKSYYKVIDGRGRITLPTDLRERVDIHSGDVIELSIKNQCICVEKLDIVKVNDSSIETMKNTVIAAAKKLDRGSLLALTKKLVDLAKEEIND